jgi:hypothetical protein
MKHKKCGGSIFVDRLLSEKKHVELNCLTCGDRWMLNKEKSKLGRWLIQREQMRENAIDAGV